MSLCQAMRILGYDSVHQYHANSERASRIMNGGWEPEHEAYFDSPTWLYPRTFTERLWEQFPAAKLIVHTRANLNDWICSQLIHVLHDRATGDNSVTAWRDLDTTEAAQQYERFMRWADEVRDDPRVLRIDVSQGDGWEKLCPFLGVPVPGVDFPRANTGQGRLQRIVERYER